MDFRSNGSCCARCFVLILTAVIATQAAADEITPEEKRWGLQSALRRETDVLVSNPVGMFRATLKDKQWQRLPIPPEMPRNGVFADVPAESKQIIYSAAEFGSYGAENQAGVIFGIYLSEDDGQRWQLLSKGHDYGPVLLHPNGQLFAATNQASLNGPSRLHVSHDLGKTWRDITGKGFGSIQSIFLDPDHKDLVCLTTWGIRGYVTQADDDSYDWRNTREWEWRRTHPNKRDFFTRSYSTGTTLYMLAGTLENYFDHDFGNRTSLPAFDIVPEHEHYEFKANQPKVIKISITFQQFKHSFPGQERLTDKQLAEVHEPVKIKFLDQRPGIGLWHLRRENASGEQVFVQSTVSKEVYQSRDRDGLKARLRADGLYETVMLSQEKPVERELDLDQFTEFNKPGRYKLQTVYDNSWLASRNQGEWVGSFAGRTFDVTIVE